MDIRTINVSMRVDLNRATEGELHTALAAAWDNYDATDVDLQVSHAKGVYTIHITGLIGDAIVFGKDIVVTARQRLPDAIKATLLLLWIETIQARVTRSLAKADKKAAAMKDRRGLDGGEVG